MQSERDIESQTLQSVTKRSIFISKTLATVAFQLFIVGIITLSSYNSEKFRTMSQESQSALVWASFAFAIVTMIITIVMVKMKMIILALIPYLVFTVFVGLMFAVGACQNDASVIIHSVGITVVATIICVSIVLCTGVNLHSYNGVASTLLTILIVSGFVFWIFPPNEDIQVLYCVLGIIVFVGYMLIDTSELIHAYEEDEWIIAAMNIFLDIINLCLYIMDLLNKCQKD